MFWLILILVITLIIYHYELSRRKLKNTPPGPLANHIPFLGYLPFLNANKPHNSLTDLAKKYGKIYSLQMGSIFTVVLSDSALIREAFKRDEFSERAPLRVTHGIFNGYGLICNGGAFWRDQRGLGIKWLRDMGMMKFGPKREIMQDRIMEGIVSCIEEISRFTSQEFDVSEIITHTVGNIANDFVFGITYEKDDETWKYLLHLQDEGVKLIGVGAVANFLPLLRFLPINQRNMKFLLTGIAQTHKLYDKIIDECEKSLDTAEPFKGRDSMLRRFLLEQRDREKRNDELAGYCSRKQLRYFLADMFGAALDTTGFSIKWYLLTIAAQTEVQEKVYQELSAYGLRETILLEDVEHLPYLKASVAESMRLNTVVPCGVPCGNPTESCTIGGYAIPKNSMVLPLLYAVHMNEDVWVEPHIYNPDRFIDADGNFMTPPSFMPFQTGKRMCLGDEMAKMVLNLFAANILLNFRIKVGRDFNKLDLSGISGLTLSPPQHRLIFEKREG